MRMSLPTPALTRLGCHLPLETLPRTAQNWSPRVRNVEWQRRRECRVFGQGTVTFWRGEAGKGEGGTRFIRVVQVEIHKASLANQKA